MCVSQLSGSPPKNSLERVDVSSLLGTDISPLKGTFEDVFPFPKLTFSKPEINTSQSLRAEEILELTFQQEIEGLQKPIFNQLEW